MVAEARTGCRSGGEVTGPLGKVGAQGPRSWGDRGAPRSPRDPLGREGEPVLHCTSMSEAPLGAKPPPSCPWISGRNKRLTSRDCPCFAFTLPAGLGCLPCPHPSPRDQPPLSSWEKGGKAQLCWRNKASCRGRTPGADPRGFGLQCAGSPCPPKEAAAFWGLLLSSAASCWGFCAQGF